MEAIRMFKPGGKPLPPASIVVEAALQAAKDALPAQEHPLEAVARLIDKQINQRFSYAEEASLVNRPEPPTITDLLTASEIAPEKKAPSALDVLKNKFSGVSVPTPNPLVASMKELIRLEDEAKAIEAELKRVKDLAEKKEAMVYELLEANDIQSTNIEGRTLYRRMDIYASIPADKKPEGFAWLKENNLDHLIQETVNSRSLTAALKEHFEQKQSSDYPECFSYTVKKRIGMRR